jgi:hypothetical protein
MVVLEVVASWDVGARSRLGKRAKIVAEAASFWKSGKDCYAR